MAARGLIWKETAGWAKGAVRTLDDIKHTGLKVGVTEKSGREKHENSDEHTVGDIAFFNEYGTMTTPARSFIRDWVDGNIDKIAKDVEKDFLRVLVTSETVREALTKRGREYRASIVKRIIERIPPPNADVTVARKGGDIPLIETGQLVEAIVAEVARK
jgi:hypothetical protein